MKGKILLILTLVIIAIVIGIIALSSKKKSIVSPLGKQDSTPTVESIKISEKLKTYEDTSGFLFQYPEGLTLSQNEATDESTFSSLKLTSDKTEGFISLEVTTSDLKSVDEWFKTNKVSTTSAKVTKITLADLEAQQFEKDKKLITVAVDIGALFLFTVDYQKEKKFWLGANKTILTSFEFKLPESSTQDSTAPASEGDIIFEGEEIIE